MKNLVFIIIAIGIVIAVASVFLSTQSVPAIQGASSLNSAAAELDKVDLSGFDKELNLLNADTSKF